ncbi:MAG: hypothetical protein A2X35_07645 [Elusimicrobia bacterium GWA2_61_42]|nr:MAG: hypothetical protein A2X35_07645 [Elusimicrobia bacterium GWA2_61_42]OGR77947.1 MAG: hypothetical protein A2X38_10675 [Elusimicrobia bacterium GWC2_61_25]
MLGKENSEIRSALMELTGTHWIGVKFHKNKPRGLKLSAPAAFCAAAAGAVTETALLKVSAIPCAGARYAFNAPGAKAPPLAAFIPARFNKVMDPAAPVSGAPRLPYAPEYVSFNLSGPADLYLSFMLNESANELAQAWAAVTGKNMDCRFTGVMSFCSEGAAAALNGKRPAVSLGCAKAIRSAGLQGQVCVCLTEGNAVKVAGAWQGRLAAAV